MPMMRGVKVRIGPPGGVGREFGNEPRELGHHIAFSTRAATTGQPAECSLTLFNLSPESRQLFESSKNIASLRVGHYDEGLKMLFRGRPDPRTLSVRKVRGDWTLDVVLRDGGRELDLSRLDVSFQTTTTGDQVVDEVIKATGLGRGEIELGRIEFPNRFVFSGMAKHALDMLISASITQGAAARRWFVRDGNLYILAKGSTTNEGAVIYSADRGTLVGSPSATEDGGVQFQGVIVDTSLRPGRVVRLESRRFNGFYKTVQVEYSGSNFDQEFYSDIKAMPYT